MAKSTIVAATRSVEPKGQMKESPGVSKGLYGPIQERMKVLYKNRVEVPWGLVSSTGLG